jgi:cellulose synthase/poly-beta-1,6-N-acetylglucosamine synthase-like glycosyltransferase
MTWFALIIVLFSTYRLYGVWLGYHRLLTAGSSGSAYDVPRDWDWLPKVTFMIPSFNEGEVVCQGIESIMACNWPKDKIEIISVDDCSLDDTWHWLQVMRDKYPENVIAWKNEVNQGKSKTLIDIVRRASGEIVFTVDSDTIIHENAVREIVSCYADPDMGGVCGNVRVKNLNDSLWTQMQAVIFPYYFYLSKTLENQFRAVRVLSGQIASFRRKVFLQFIPLIESRNILGLTGIRSGEDTYVTTRMVTGSGMDKPWKAFNNAQAFAWTNNPADMYGYLKQQLRWWRSQASGYMVLFDLWANIHRAGVLRSFVTFMNAVGAMLWFVSLIYLFSIGLLLTVLVSILFNGCIIGIVSSLLYNRMIGRHDRAGKLKNPFLTGIWYGCWMMVSMCALIIIAMFTLDDGGWVTRQKGNF